jgi:catechol 2,3-dioxygenase-like lactoylglutathione lyase family enzyme
MKLAAVSFLVRDYDEAVSWFVNCLGFSLLENTVLPQGKRWVKVGNPDGTAALILALADGPEQVSQIGNSVAGRVAYFLETDDFNHSFHHMKDNGVCFLESPRHEIYGIVAVFEDLYGNRWDLIEPMKKPGHLDRV